MEKIGLLICELLIVVSAMTGLISFCATFFGREDVATPVLVGWSIGVAGMWALWMVGGLG